MDEDSQHVQPIVIRDPKELGLEARNIIIQLPPQRRTGPHWGWFFLIFFSAVLVLLAVLAAFNAYRVEQLDQFLKVDRKILAQTSRPLPVHYPAGTSRQFPPSMTLRLTGTINDGQLLYVAQSANGSEYVTIPAKECRVISGGPVCHYQGRSVTRFTGMG